MLTEPYSSINRDEIIARAQVKYIDTGVTKNITEALELYLKNDAGPDEQIPLFITSPEIHQIREVMKQVRPTCDDCDSEMFLQVKALDPAGREHPTAWTCKKCGIILYSDKSAAEWLKELKDEARSQNIPGTNKPHGPAMPAMRKGPQV